MDSPLIYNLSCGKSVPEWLSERKRKTLLKKNPELKKRIELVQDFDMPGLSNMVKVTPDGKYIMATGIYKPRIKCYDVNHLAMKFERCFDSEAITFEILSNDYSKFVILQCDRYIEFHSQEGRYYKLRIPKFGRDMKYHFPTCDLFIGGSSREIYRLNLTRGQFLNPFVSSAGDDINKLAINPIHNMLIIGTREGKIEAWDTRSHTSIGILDCALNSVMTKCTDVAFPSITALQFENDLTLGIGNALGQILLYDIRSNKPFMVKDHLYGLPIKNISFQDENVLSMDSSCIKIWNKENGKLFAAIESGNETKFNNFCVVPKSGLLFIANENTKIQTHYIPSLGPAPKWCGFLDTLVEELEETNKETMYDNYKFTTRNEIEELGLSHLIGTNLLKGYMHGYFVDIRLYRKAKSVIQPFAYDSYRKKEIRQKIESERTNRVQKYSLPVVNKEFAIKLINDELENTKMLKSKHTVSLLKDDRFKALFENPDFQVDKNAEEYKLLNPVLKRLDKSKQKLVEAQIQEQFDPVDGENGFSSDDSSDDDTAVGKELKKEYRSAKQTRLFREKELHKHNDKLKIKPPKFYEIKEGEEFAGLNGNSLTSTQSSNITLGERIHLENFNSVKMLSSGNRQLTFSTQKGPKHNKAIMEAVEHRKTRKNIIRKGPKNLRKPNAGGRFVRTSNMKNK